MLLSPLGIDSLKVHTTINKTKPSVTEFQAARAKATELRSTEPVDPTQRDHGFMANINRNVIQITEQPQHRPSEGPAIIAPWTII